MVICQVHENGRNFPGSPALPVREYIVMNRGIILLLIACLPALSCKSGDKKPTGPDSGSAPVASDTKAGPETKNAPEPAKPAKPARGELVNAVSYVVGDIPITRYDIAEMEKNLKYLQAPGEKNRISATDELINRAIIQLEATQESLFVSDTRIENEIRRRKETSGITDEDEFQKAVTKQTGMPYQLWVQELPHQIMKSQIIQLKVQAPPPSEEEMEAFYKANKEKVGVEVAWREVVFRFHKTGPRSELNIAKIAREVEKKIQKEPNKFAQIAQSYPQAQYRGHGYKPLHELARANNELAGLLFNLQAGQLGPLFRRPSEYLLVMPTGKRATPFDKLRKIIYQRLTIDKVEEAFQQWLQNKKKEIAIIEIK